MKRIVLLLISILGSLSVSAQAKYLGRTLDDGFLISYFDDYSISRGEFSSSRKVYPSSRFEGTSGGIRTSVETNSEGKISTINCYYTNFTSKERIVSFAEELVKHNFARVTSKELTETSLSIKAQISDSPYNYKSMAITSNWNYNSYGSFFFGSFWVWYSWLSL